MRTLPRKIWSRIHEPRAVAIAQALIYVLLGAGGLTALIDPPRTLEGTIGMNAMLSLATLLTAACLIGIPAALFGIQWLERYAVYAVAISTAIYGGIVIVAQATTPGNRFLQLGFVLGMLVAQFIRWWRIKDMPYDRALTLTDPLA